MATSVRLSPETIEILKNISTINNSIKFKQGTRLRAMSNSNSVFIDAEIKETIPEDFAIYELSKFLNVLALPNLKDAELIFDDKEYVTIQSNGTKIVYYFTEESFVVYPDKEITLPSVDLTTSLEQDDIENFLRAASALNHKLLVFSVKDEKVTLVATTPEIDTSNDYEVELGEAEGAIDGDYKIRVEHLKILPGDYEVEICAKGIAKFSHKTRELIYYVGLERV